MDDNIYIINYNRHHLYTIFPFNPFKSQYVCYHICLELANKFSVFTWFLSSFEFLLGHHQGARILQNYNTACKFFRSRFCSIYTCVVGWLVSFTAYQPFWVIQHRIKYKKIQFSISKVFGYKLLDIITFLFQIIQFSISIQFQCQKQFYFKQFSLAKVHRLVLLTHR